MHKIIAGRFPNSCNTKRRAARVLALQKHHKTNNLEVRQVPRSQKLAAKKGKSELSARFAAPYHIS